MRTSTMPQFSIRRLSWMVLLLMVSTTSLQADVDPGPTSQSAGGTKWALLIGVNEYDNEAFSTLRYCSADVVKLKDALLAGGFREDHVIVLSDLESAADRRPTRENIENAWLTLLEKTEPGDTLLITFSGHGVNIDGKSYLCPADANRDLHQTTMLSMDVLMRSLAESEAAQKMFIVDACRNDQLPAGAERFDLLVGSRSDGRTNLPQGTIILSSCLAGQHSIEDEEIGGGLFMHFVSDGLIGHADFEIAGNRDGHIAPMELFAYAAEHTERRSFRKYAWTQRPWFKGGQTHNLRLVSLSDEQRQALGRSSRESAPVVETAEQLHAQAQYAEAVVALRNFDIARVIALCTSAIEYDPEHRQSYRMRAMAYRFQGKLKEAVDDYSKINETVLIPVRNGSRTVMRGSETAGTAQPGDWLEISGTTVYQSNVWYRVKSIYHRKQESTDFDRSETTGYVQLPPEAAQANPQQQIAMVEQFQRRNQQPYIPYANSSAERRTRIEQAAQTYQQIRNIPYVNQYLPAIPRPSIPYVGSIPGIPW